jgi:hypothetical protein
VTEGSASASANTTGTASEFGWTMDSLWMSSISKAWPAVLFTSTAFASEVRCPLPQTEASGLPPSSHTNS